MPAPVIKGLMDFLTANVTVPNLPAYAAAIIGAPIQCWDSSDIPRFDLNGVAINPQSVVNPSTWPIITIQMPKGRAFHRNWTFEDPYDDEGEVEIQIHGISRAQTEPLADAIVQQFASAGGWTTVALFDTAENKGGFGPQNPAGNPYYVVSMLLTDWSSVMEEEQRLAGGQLWYHYDLWYQCRIHGAVSTA